MFNQKSGYSSPFTLFVDNLPEDVGPRWFRHFFSQFGVVRRAFILKKKRSRRSGQPFGFITFGSINEASYAISKSNSLRLGGRYLVVKWARFRSPHKNPEVSNSSSQPFARYNVGKFENYGTGPVLESHNQPLEVDESATFNVKPIASEWLSRSVVVLLKSPFTTELVSKAFDQANFPDVVVKSLGGLSMILTFSSKEVGNLALTDSTLRDWFISLKPWNGESASLSRFVWLKCRGMPLQSWNVNTFKRIGDYCGVCINTDAETALELSYDVGRILISTDYQDRIEEWINLVVNGNLYKVKIWEEDCDDPFSINIFKVKENIGVQTGISLSEPTNPKGVTSHKLPLMTTDLSILNYITSPNLVEEHSANNVINGSNSEPISILGRGKELPIQNNMVVSNKACEDTQRYSPKDAYEDNGLLVGGCNKDLACNENNSPNQVLENNSVFSNVGPKTDVEAKHGVQSDVGIDEVEYSKFNQGEVGNVVEAVDSRTSSLEIENSVLGNEVVLDSFGGSLNPSNYLEDKDLEDGISSGMFFEDNNKEAEFADEDLVCNENAINEDELNHDHFDANNIPIKGIKGKSNRKSINEILGYSKVNKGNTRGRRNKNKCVVLRSAVASATLFASISSGGINNRNRIMLDEEKAIWELDKLFGIRYDGEEEVISKIAEMEALNKDRADVRQL